MIPLPDVLRRFAGLEEAELVGWIERRWVLAEPGPEGWRFHEGDVARVQLILEIRRDHAIDEDATELVLSLLDQVYRLRRQLKALTGAVAAQPEDVRARVLAALDPRA